MLILLPLALSTELKNDSCACDGGDDTVYFQGGFVDGECWGSTFHPDAADYPFTPEYVTFLVGRSGTEYVDIFLYEVDGDGKPTTQILGDAVQVTGSQQN